MTGLTPDDLAPVLAASALAPQFVAKLAASCRIHDRLHERDPVAFRQLAPQIVAIVGSGRSRVDAALLAQLPALKIVALMGTGYEHIDLVAARTAGVAVTHTPNVLNDDVAELAIGLMLATARQLVTADKHVRDDHWLQGPMPLARRMSGARLGLLGMGRIGQTIAQRAGAFGMIIAYHSRTAKPELPYRHLPDPCALAEQSDFLVAITPGGPGTSKLVDAAVLAALGKDGIFVNVSRGSVVDEGALIDALERGVIAGAGLDVFETEPRVPARLCALPQVVLTPHIGSATLEARQAMAEQAYSSLQAALQGFRPPCLVPELR